MNLIRFLLRRIVALSWREKLLFLEATTALALASAAIAIFRFRRVVELAGFPSVTSALPAEIRGVIGQRVCRSVVVCARYLPWRPMCFPQGLAAQWMLRRRGIPSTLCYGARPDAAKGLVAHVWVCDGETPLIGGEAAREMGLLARFPPGELPC